MKINTQRNCRKEDFRCKELSKENISLRIFRIPIINFFGDNYLSMVDWNSVDLTSPPLLQNFSEQDILNTIELPLDNIYQYSSGPVLRGGVGGVTPPTILM